MIPPSNNVPSVQGADSAKDSAKDFAKEYTKLFCFHVENSVCIENFIKIVYLVNYIEIRISQNRFTLLSRIFPIIFGKINGPCKMGLKVPVFPNIIFDVTFSNKSFFLLSWL